jgi:hypothetical protein
MDTTGNLQQSPSKPRQKAELGRELARTHLQCAGTVTLTQADIASMLRQTAVPRKVPPAHTPSSFHRRHGLVDAKLNEARSFTESLSRD